MIHAGKTRPESGQEAEWHSGNHTRKGKEERKRKKEKRGREGREERMSANRRKLWTCRAVSASRRLHPLSGPRALQSGGWGRLDLGRRVVAFQSTTAKNKRSAKGSKTPREKAPRQGPEANEPAPGREEWQRHCAQRGVSPPPNSLVLFCPLILYKHSLRTFSPYGSVPLGVGAVPRPPSAPFLGGLEIKFLRGFFPTA